MPSSTPAITVTLTPAAKPWWKSRTIVANAAVLALAAAEAKLSLLQPLLPVNVYAVLAFALPVVNVVLRSVTTAAVTLRSAGPEVAP